jgi:hypothetical protein
MVIPAGVVIWNAELPKNAYSTAPLGDRSAFRCNSIMRLWLVILRQVLSPESILAMSPSKP